MTDKIKIGDNEYTPEQIRVINELFGEGFLEQNPWFPGAPGANGYKMGPDWKYHSSHPILLQERQRRIAAEAEKERQHILEQERQQPTLLFACTEAGSAMHHHEEIIVAKILGQSKNDCREKFVRQHLKDDSPNWQAVYKEWLSHWHYERFETDIIGLTNEDKA